MAKRKRFDPKAPEAQALRDEIVHGTFIKEGTLVAFPLCFPGDSTPVPADESHVTALDVAANWMVYGGTSGRAAHLFVGMFPGATGCVLDLGAVEGATKTAAVCCGRKKVAGLVNGPAGGRALVRPLQGLPFDLLQEWGFRRVPYEDLGEIVPGERVVHAVADRSRQRASGITEGHLFVLDLDEGAVEVVGEVEGRGRLAMDGEGAVYGLDRGSTFWRYEPWSGRLERRARPAPCEVPDDATVAWVWCPVQGDLYLADPEGRLFLGTAEVGRTQHAPVRAMAVTTAGRLFGWCGEGIARMFCYDPSEGAVRDLGCAVSVLERRRYGYQFAAAAVGRDGQVYFGEDDDLGHLWIYFPRVLPRR